MSEDSTPALALGEVTKVYGGANRSDEAGKVRALDGVSLRVGRGELVALMGPSGCGKSTLLHVAGLIDQPDSGQVLIDGRDASKLGDDARTLLRRKSIGVVSQFFNLLPTLTIRENVSLPVVLAGIRGAAARDAAHAVLDSMGLRYLGERYPHQLSGGQMQRVAIARAMIHAPALLLADEPTGSLDSASSQAILNIFLRLNTEQGQTIVIATHAPYVATVCSRHIHMSDGKIVSDEPNLERVGAAGVAPPTP